MQYSDITYSDTYFQNTSKFSTWSTKTDDEKNILLNDASKYIDVSFNYVGTAVKEDSAFPRYDLYNIYTRKEYDSTEIPTIIKNATCEIAYKMISEDIMSDVEDIDDLNVTSEKVGSLQVDYSEKRIKAVDNTFGFIYLKPFINASIGVSSLRYTKG